MNDCHLNVSPVTILKSLGISLHNPQTSFRYYLVVFGASCSAPFISSPERVTTIISMPAVPSFALHASRYSLLHIMEKKMSECMWFGCRLLVAVVSQAYPRNAKICPGFPPPQAALCIILGTALPVASF